MDGLEWNLTLNGLAIAVEQTHHDNQISIYFGSFNLQKRIFN